MSVATLADVLTILENSYPAHTAQSWDKVGLVAGDHGQPIQRIHFAVDPTLDVVREAVTAGADLLVTHHPLLLRGIHSVATTTAKGTILTEAIVADLALFCAHTNADSAFPGVNTALAAACGLDPEATSPLSIEEGSPLGLVGDLPTPIRFDEFVTRLAEQLPRTAVGVRASGPAHGQVQRVALLGGAGDSLFNEVRAAKADVYVTSDLRHHPASEAREEAFGATPYLVDAGHYATEHLWLAEAAETLRSNLHTHGHVVDVYVSELVTDPWSFVIGAHGPCENPERM
ncbi:metal-binding protein [Dermatophilus congolensis]|uniref:GTP cyclohydrolase 1 type 2 homolog n=1 Tax=Dermatophilus congolensis TaxID=1863 RepID=A0AA46BMR3_9MICO|nr:Nif3-like dinuclear metal center hexameric protein [Dermatophilus congolensis]STD08142.1 metal-binding protein [Dermatophilus congolensis]